MLKQSVIFFILFSLHSSVYHSQNLVPNPSFETYTACPNGSGQVSYASGWNVYANSPDYFNVCGTMGSSVPLNAFGYQFPVNGNAYAGFLNYVNKSYIGSSNWREHIGRALSNTLVVGTKYYVSLKVVLSIEPIVPSNCASSKMGILFSTIPFSPATPPPINNAPKVYSNSIITDTLNWTRIFGSFVSDSAYQYLAIGNFFTDSNTDTLILSGGTACASYYYVDDVCVSTDSSFTANYATAIKPLSIENNLIFFPNPADKFFSIINMFDDKLYIYNKFEEEIFKADVESRDILIDCSTWPAGIYFIVSKNIHQKIIINH